MEVTLTTLNHLVLRAKQIKEIADDFDAMNDGGVTVCSLAGECGVGSPSIHVDSESLLRLSMLANQQIAINPRYDSEYPTDGSFTYSGVYFFSLFSAEEAEAYRANL